MDLTPVVLESERVRLEPLTLGHLDGLCSVGLDPHLWRWYAFALTTREMMKDYVESLLEEQGKGTTIAFVTVDRASGAVVGATRFLHIDAANRRLEIGTTWIGAKWQRTYVNTHAKLLMLTHAFELMKVQRVEFRTDALNVLSRAAIKRLGAVPEGTLRKHGVTHTGRVRDTVVFSIVDDEWGKVKEMLEAKALGTGH